MTRFTDTRVALLYTNLILAWLARVQPVVIKGIGATFPAEVYSVVGPAFQAYRNDFVEVEFSYELQNSDNGKSAMFAREPEVTFGASESDMTPSEATQHPDVRVIPVLAGGVVLAYNLPGVSKLVLTRETIVGIYNGTIRKWNDPEISRTNPDYFFPWEDIRPVARADTSGTTELFTRTLSAISPEWNATYGTFDEGLNEFFGGNERPIHWNSSVIRYYGRSNRGMTGLIFSYRYSIGYVAIGEALAVNWSYALIVNRAGHVVDVDVPSTERVMREAFRNTTSSGLVGSLADSWLPDAYPFLGFSCLVVKAKEMANCESAVEFYNFVRWLLRDEQARSLANKLMYDIIIGELADVVIADVMDAMTCNGSLNVKQLVEEQRDYEEWLASRPLRIGLAAGLTTGLTLFLSMMSYIAYQQIKLKRSLRAGDWNIQPADIEIRWDREKGWLTEPSSRLSDLGSLTTAGQSVLSEGTFSLFVTKYGRWNGRTVCLRRFPAAGFRVGKTSTKMAIVTMKTRLIHTNVLRFYGVCVMDGQLYLVSEHAEKGSLTDVLQNAGYRLEDNLKYALALDIANGMDFLHNNGIVHGHLTSDCCLLDCRWNVKVTQWEISRLSSEEREKNLARVQPLDEEGVSPEVKARLKLWTAPELLGGAVKEANRKSDVYSFAIVLVEVFTREDPYWDLDDKMSTSEIIAAVQRDGIRPDLSTITNVRIKTIIADAWHQDPDRRPTFGSLIHNLRKSRTSRKTVIESMMDTLEEYIGNLEEKVQERTAELASVNKSLENLLYQILPPSVARSLSLGQTVQPEGFDSATIFFSDIVGFTALCAVSTPIEVVNLLNDLYTTFDSVIDTLDVYKVETIGDAYMCISGVPIRNGIKHAANIAEMALQIMTAARSFKIRHKPNEKLQLRAGIHTGPVVAGVVGVKMPRYCLFGDTVNTASRMESTSIAMRIQVSEATHALLQQIGGYRFEARGKVQVKGKGEMVTYFLVGRADPKQSDSNNSTHITTREPAFPSLPNIKPLSFMRKPAEESPKTRKLFKRMSVTLESGQLVEAKKTFQAKSN